MVEISGMAMSFDVIQSQGVGQCLMMVYKGKVQAKFGDVMHGSSFMTMSADVEQGSGTKNLAMSFDVILCRCHGSQQYIIMKAVYYDVIKGTRVRALSKDVRE